MLNHGVSTGALFAGVGLLYERRHSLDIKDYGGVATVAPWLATAFLITSLASAGLPLLNGFVVSSWCCRAPRSRTSAGRCSRPSG